MCTPAQCERGLDGAYTAQITSNRAGDASLHNYTTTFQLFQMILVKFN